MTGEVIAATFEAVADAVGDPVPLIYEKLFQLHPDMEALFVLDNDGAARGNMLAEFLDCLLDLASDGHYAANHLQTLRINHDELGVPVDVFPVFFDVVRDSFRSVLGAAWTAEMEAAWAALAREFAHVLELETV